MFLKWTQTENLHVKFTAHVNYLESSRKNTESFLHRIHKLLQLTELEFHLSDRSLPRWTQQLLEVEYLYIQTDTHAQLSYDCSQHSFNIIALCNMTLEISTQPFNPHICKGHFLFTCSNIFAAGSVVWRLATMHFITDWQMPGSDTVKIIFDK